MQQIGHFLNGRHVAPSGSDASQDVFNPATGDVTGRVTLGGADVVAQAVAYANAAWPA